MPISIQLGGRHAIFYVCCSVTLVTTVHTAQTRLDSSRSALSSQTQHAHIRKGIVHMSLHYFQSLRMDMSLSLSFFMTFVTAISRSSWVTCTLRSRRANMPASVQQALSSAPEAPDI